MAKHLRLTAQSLALADYKTVNPLAVQVLAVLVLQRQRMLLVAHMLLISLVQPVVRLHLVIMRLLIIQEVSSLMQLCYQ
jgi:hypothetical protein